VASVISDKDYCLFYRFWAFEYGKRNKQFLDAIDRIYSTHDPQEKKLCRKALSSWGFTGWIEYYCNNYKNKIAPLGIIDGNIEIQYPDNPLFMNDGVTIISFNGTGEEHKFHGGHRLRQGQALAKLDFSVSLKSLLCSISEEYEKYSKSAELVKHAGMNFFDVGDVFTVERRRISSLEDISFEVDHVPRAVGVWIWDYVDSKWGVHPPAKQTGFLAEAADALKSISPEVNKRYGASGHQTFSKLYKRTADCINSVKVLTLK